MLSRTSKYLAEKRCRVEREEVSQVNGEKRGRHGKEAKAQRVADLDKWQSVTVKIK